MDRLRWDSEVYEEYLTDLRKMNRCLSEQIQKVTNARMAIMRHGVTAEDKTLHQILDRLEEAQKRLTMAGDRIHQLMEALELSMDMFRSAEKKIGNLGADLLYLGVIRGWTRPIVLPYVNPVIVRDVTPDWLTQVASTART